MGIVLMIKILIQEKMAQDNVKHADIIGLKNGD